MVKVVTAVVLVTAMAAWGQATKPGAASRPAFRPVQGQRVEVYWVRQWWSATARDVRADQVLVRHDQRGRAEEWVPLSTVRRFTKAGKYPMPAGAEEIEAQNLAEASRREAEVALERPGARTTVARPGRAGKGEEFVDVDAPKGDVSGVRRLADTPDVPVGPVEADAEAAPKAVASRPMPLSGNPKAEDAGFAPRGAAVLAVPGAGQVVSVCEVFGSRPVRLLQRFDVATGNPTPVVAIESSVAVKGFSPDGKRVVGVNDQRKGHFGEGGAVEVWSVEGREAKLVVAFSAGWEGNEGHFLDHARFTDNDHVLTRALGKLTCWSVPDAKAVWTREIGHGSAMAVSAGGRYVAVAGATSVRLLDAATGAAMGWLPAAEPRIRASQLAFSASGKRLLAAENQRLVVYDLTKPAVVADMALPAPLWGGVFLSDDYVLVSGEYVVDLAKGVVLWDYPHGKGPWGVYAGRVWYLSEAEESALPTLYSAALPTEEAVKAVGAVEPEAVFAVRPGTKVALRLDMGLEAANQAKALVAVRDAVEAAGWVVAEDAPVRVVASHSTGETKETTYRMNTGETRKVSVATRNYALSVEVDGKKLWESAASHGASMMVSPRGGQTIEQSIDEERERMATAFFTQARFPKLLARPSERPGFGQTVLPGGGKGAEGAPGVRRPRVGPRVPGKVGS